MTISNNDRWLRVFPLALCAAGFAACAAPPTTAAAPKAPAARAAAPTAPVRAPDPNASPASAERLAFGLERADAVDRSAGDLDDWFLLEFPAAGQLKVVVQGPKGAPLPNLFVALTDSAGQFPGNPTRSGGRPRVELTPLVAKGTRLLWIGTEPEATAMTAYSVRAEFTPRAQPKPQPAVAKPPPPPPMTVFASKVVEFAQGQGETQFATITGGTQAGLRVGLRGRLKDGSQVIGTFQIVEVFSAGSRVRIDGRLAAAVTGQTVVEVDVPK